MEFGELLIELTLILNALHRKNVCYDGHTLSQCFILLSVPDGGMDMSTLSEKLGLDNSTTTRLVNTLEKHGLIRRERGQEDRRVMVVRLTPKGHELTHEIEEVIDSLGDAVLDNIPSEKRERVKESLEAVFWSLSKEKLKQP